MGAEDVRRQGNYCNICTLLQCFIWDYRGGQRLTTNAFMINARIVRMTLLTLLTLIALNVFRIKLLGAKVVAVEVCRPRSLPFHPRCHQR